MIIKINKSIDLSEMLKLNFPQNRIKWARIKEIMTIEKSPKNKNNFLLLILTYLH
jgi:hypothetical protein